MKRITVYIFMFFLLVSCKSTLKIINFCPYVFEKADILFTKDLSENVLVLSCDIKNLSDRCIKFIKIDLSVKDENDSSVFIGDNIYLKIQTLIFPEETKNIKINLDEYIIENIGTNCKIDGIFISEVIFDDGQKWMDIFGRYSIY